MTTTNYLTCDNPRNLFNFYKKEKLVTDSKCRMFCIACCQLINDTDFGQLDEYEELGFYDSEDELLEDREWCDAWTRVSFFGPCPEIRCDILREIFGPPQAITLPKTPKLKEMAAAIYESRSFEDMPILWDLLETEGCVDVLVFQHCLGKTLSCKTILTDGVCPECGNSGKWRSGVGFEHEKICMKRSLHLNQRNVVWEPGTRYELYSWVYKIPCVRGCWLLRNIMEQQ